MAKYCTSETHSGFSFFPLSYCNLFLFTTHSNLDLTECVVQHYSTALVCNRGYLTTEDLSSHYLWLTQNQTTITSENSLKGHRESQRELTVTQIQTVKWSYGDVSAGYWAWHLESLVWFIHIQMQARVSGPGGTGCGRFGKHPTWASLSEGKLTARSVKQTLWHQRPLYWTTARLTGQFVRHCQEAVSGLMLAAWCSVGL